MKPSFLKGFLLIGCLEGWVALVSYFQYPSMGGNAFLLGYSFSRLSIGAGYGLAVLAITILTFRFWLNQKAREKLLSWINYQSQCPQRLWEFAIISLISGLFLVFLLSWLKSPGKYYDDLYLRIVFERLQSGMIWLAAFAFQLLILLVISFPQYFRDPKSYDLKKGLKIMLAMFLPVICAWHALVLIFQIPVFTSIRRWLWYFHIKEVHWIAVIIILGLSIGILYWVYRFPNRNRQNLIALVLLGYILQVGFGFVEGLGFESIRQKSVNAGHVVYLQAAARQPSLQDVLFHYDETFGDDSYLATKPPVCDPVLYVFSTHIEPYCTGDR